MIFLDDFDSLIPHPTLSSTLCSTLLVTQNKLHIYGLQSVVAIGLSSIVKCTGNKPPFTTASCWEVPPFSRKEVNALFAQFSSAWRAELEDGIVEDIYKLTNGHPATVCWIMKRIEKWLLNTDRVSKVQWQEYVEKQLCRYFSLPFLFSFLLTG